MILSQSCDARGVGHLYKAEGGTGEGRPFVDLAADQTQIVRALKGSPTLRNWRMMSSWDISPSIVMGKRYQSQHRGDWFKRQWPIRTARHWTEGVLLALCREITESRQWLRRWTPTRHCGRS